nr:uncharacterized protein LOC121117698 [Lepeophtheirus salmonis]
MNTKIIFTSVLLLSMTAQLAQGTIAITATAGAAALALTATQTTTILGGLLLLKKAALLASAYHTRNTRARRDVVLGNDDDSAEFSFLSAAEPSQCYRRLICDLASGKLGKSENEVLLDMFKEETPITNPKFEYMIASKLGKITKSIESCEIRYGCQLTGDEMNKLLA